MKKRGILNPAICSLLAELGQTDELLIVDAAYPLPTDGHVIDLTLTQGIPRLLDVVRAVAEELVIESIAVPVEMKEYSPRLYQELVKILGDIDVDEVPFHEFKEQSLERQGHHPHRRVQLLCQRSDRGRERLLTGNSEAQRLLAGVAECRRTGVSRIVCRPCREEKKARGGQPKPDSVEVCPGGFAAWPGLG